MVLALTYGQQDDDRMNQDITKNWKFSTIIWELMRKSVFWTFACGLKNPIYYVDSSCLIFLRDQHAGKLKDKTHKRIFIFPKELTLYCIFLDFLALASALKNVSYSSRYFLLQVYFADVAWWWSMIARIEDTCVLLYICKVSQKFTLTLQAEIRKR